MHIHYRSFFGAYNENLNSILCENSVRRLSCHGAKLVDWSTIQRKTGGLLLNRGVCKKVELVLFTHVQVSKCSVQANTITCPVVIGSYT